MKKDNVFWGVILLLAAAYIIINNLGFMQDINVIRLAVAVICVLVFCKSLLKMQFGGMLFSLAILLILFDEQLGIEAITPWPVLCAAALGSIGLDMIFGKSVSTHRPVKKKGQMNEAEADYISGEDIMLSGMFNGLKKTISSDDFCHAFIRSRFAGMEISFDDAIIQNGSAVIDLDVLFSGVEIYIPKSWQIINETDTVFAGFEEHHGGGGTEGPKIIFRGDVKFSGVEIYRV